MLTQLIANLLQINDRNYARMI
ncbi:hypothetical protein EMIT0P258_180004 [Pseudomonas sp. IT-P258]